MLFAADTLNRQPGDDMLRLRSTNPGSPVCVDADAAVLDDTERGRPLLQLYEEYMDGGGGEELSNEKKLMFLTALDWR